MPWNKTEIQNHLKAAALLEQIKNEAFNHLSQHPQITEYQLQQFILKKFEENKLKVDKDQLIVAFGPSAATPHYSPPAPAEASYSGQGPLGVREGGLKHSRRLKSNTLVLIDIWSRLKKRNAPFADITWTGFYGKKVPVKVDKVFKAVIDARDKCLRFIDSRLRGGKMPTGREVDELERRILTRAGYGKNILHTTGHSIGFQSPHGKEGHLSLKNDKPLLINMGYTIEPGLYFKGQFGIRSEINFYINRNKRIILTTPLQRELIVI